MSAGTEAVSKMGDAAVGKDEGLKELKSLSIPLSNPVQVASYLNDRFPTQTALTSEFDTFSTQLTAAESRVDTQLATLMRIHRHDTVKTATAIIETDTAVENVQRELATLKTSATRARANMEEALKPAMPVYTALQNVSATLDALDAVVKLDEAVKVLEQVIRSSDLTILTGSSHDTVATLDKSLQALNNDSTKDIRGVAKLRTRATVVRDGLRATVLTAFKVHSDAVSNMDSATTDKHELAVNTLQAACKVAVMMGADVKAEVIGAFVRRRRSTLRAAFGNSERSTKVLSETDRRFSWVRRELRTHWAQLGGERVNRGWGRVFPADWSVARRVADGLIAECRDATSAALDAGAHNDVDTMIIALGKAKEFEVELDRRFANSSQPVTQQATDAAPKSLSFVGAISDCFGPWMNTYVSHEDTQLGSSLSQLVRDETWRSEFDVNEKKAIQRNSLNKDKPIDSGNAPKTDDVNDPLVSSGDHTAAVVLKSATELFLAIKKSMRTCAALDVGQALFSLHRVFRKHLATYASVLVRHLPGVRGKKTAGDPSSSSSSSSSSAPSTSSSISAKGSEELDTKLVKACAIINTAHYCAVTTEQLEERLREIIATPFKSDVNLSAERERFRTVCARGVQAVVALVDEDVDSELRTISTRDWSKLKEVGDTSLYIEAAGRKLTSVVQSVSRRLSKTHLRFLLEKLASTVIAHVRTHIYRCSDPSSTATASLVPSTPAGTPATSSAATTGVTPSPAGGGHISGIAAQQLLLDVTTLRGILVGLPASVNAATATTFVKMVNRDIGKVEAVLKVILAPLGSCVDTYVALVADHGSAPDFQRILEIRGLNRADAARFVLDYSRRIAPSQRLKPTSVGRTASGSFASDGRAISANGESRAVADDDYAGAAQSSSGAAKGSVPRLQNVDANSATQSSTGTDAAAAVDSMRNLFGRLGNSLIETGLTDRLEQVSSQFESTTDQLKKGVAAGRWNLFGK